MPLPCSAFSADGTWRTLKEIERDRYGFEGFDRHGGNLRWFAATR